MHYVRPEVEDYGDLVSRTADGVGMAHLGLGALAAVSSPVVPTTGGGDVLPSTDSSGTPGSSDGGGDDAGDVAGDTASGDSDGGSAGGGSGGGGSSGGGGGGGGGKLAFTGFVAAAVGAIGAGLTGAGAAVRKYLARR